MYESHVSDEPAFIDTGIYLHANDVSASRDTSAVRSRVYESAVYVETAFIDTGIYIHPSDVSASRDTFEPSQPEDETTEKQIFTQPTTADTARSSYPPTNTYI